MRTQSSSFSRTERQLLDAICPILNDEVRVIFEAQVAAINLVQRHPHGTIVAFYRKRWWRVNWEGVPLFARRDEFRLASVIFKAGAKRFKAVLTCIKGHIFDFAISPSPKHVWDFSFDEVSKVELLEDPMTTAFKPASIVVVPEEWRRLLSNESFAQNAGWVLHGENTAYRMPIEDGEYLILAERDGQEFVLWKVEPPDSQFYYMSEHDSEPTPFAGHMSMLFNS